jgi:hypothetical protein
MASDWVRDTAPRACSARFAWVMSPAHSSIPRLAWSTIELGSTGTYNGHEGAVWTLDVNWASTLLLTGSADTTARLWDVQTGEHLFTFGHRCPVRSVGFAEGDKHILTVGDNSFGQTPSVYIYDLMADDLSRRTLVFCVRVHLCASICVYYFWFIMIIMIMIIIIFFIFFFFSFFWCGCCHRKRQAQGHI